MQDKDKSGIRILLAIFFWFLSYSGIQTFLTLYATRHLGIPAGDAGRLTGHMAILIAFSPSLLAFWASRIGRRVTISIGIILLAVLNTLIALSPSAFLITTLAKLPLLGTIRVLNVFLVGVGVHGH